MESFASCEEPVKYLDHLRNIKLIPIPLPEQSYHTQHHIRQTTTTDRQLPRYPSKTPKTYRDFQILKPHTSTVCPNFETNCLPASHRVNKFIQQRPHQLRKRKKRCPSPKPTTLPTMLGASSPRKFPERTLISVFLSGTPTFLTQ